MDTLAQIENAEAAHVSSGMKWSGHMRATILLAVPLVGAQIGHMAINITDTVMVGRLGARELAAVVLGTQAFFFVFIFGTGFAQAVMPIAAVAEGRGDARGVRRSVRMGLWVLLLFSVLVMPPLWYLERILIALGQEPDVSALAGDYIRVAQWAMFPALFIMGMRSHLAVVGKAHVLMWLTIVGVVLNIGLNYLFIYGHFGMPALGIVGAAVASLGTNLIGAACLVWYANRSPMIARYDLFVRFWRPEWPAFFEVLRLGWPIGLTIIAEVALFTASSIMVGWLGTIPLAAHGIALQVTSVAFMVPLGLSAAATIRVGMAHGQQDLLALTRAGWSAMWLAMGFSVAAALTFWLFPEMLIGFYLDDSDAVAGVLVASAIPLFHVAAAFQMVDGMQCLSAGLLRGLKDTRVPMIIAIVSYWMVGMPAAYGFGFMLDYGAVGVWFGLAAGLTVAALFLTWRFCQRDRIGMTAP